VPLATQAVTILTELHQLTGLRKYVFPGRDPQKPMSDAAINAALRFMGYDTKTEITGHGFRAMARTNRAVRCDHCLPEGNYQPDKESWAGSLSLLIREGGCGEVRPDVTRER